MRNFYRWLADRFRRLDRPSQIVVVGSIASVIIIVLVLVFTAGSESREQRYGEALKASIMGSITTTILRGNNASCELTLGGYCGAYGSIEDLLQVTKTMKMPGPCRVRSEAQEEEYWECDLRVKVPKYAGATVIKIAVGRNAEAVKEQERTGKYCWSAEIEGKDGEWEEFGVKGCLEYRAGSSPPLFLKE